MPFLESCAGQLEKQPDADSHVISRHTVSGKKLGGGGEVRDWEWD